MRSWQAADAKQNFARLVDAAQSGPQLLVRHTEPVGVVLSIAEYQRMKSRADQDFAAFLISSPFEAADFDDPIGATSADG